MKRKLGKFESASAITGENEPWNIVVSVFLEGVPSGEILRQALDILQMRHPFLRVRLTKEKNSYFFESGEIPPIPISADVRENDEHWVSVVEEELNRFFDTQRGPLMMCRLISGDEYTGEIILTAHHAIVDGISIELFSRELIELCATIYADGDTSSYTQLDPIPPVETFFPEEYNGFALTRKSLVYFLRQMGDEFTYQMNTRGKRKPSINPNARVKIIHFNTEEGLTTSLVRRARKERVTLNSVVSAAALLAVQKHLYNNASMPYRYMSMADLRPYLNNPPSNHNLGSYISMMRYTIMVHDAETLWSLARRVNDQIYQSVKKGEKYLASFMSEQFMKMIFSLKKFRMCATAISYTGPSINPNQPTEPYKIKTIRGFVSNFGLGPEFSGVVGLYSGMLTWDMLYLDSDMDRKGVQTIADEIHEIFERSVNEPDVGSFSSVIQSLNQETGDHNR